MCTSPVDPIVGSVVYQDTYAEGTNSWDQGLSAAYGHEISGDWRTCRSALWRAQKLAAEMIIARATDGSST